MHNNNSKGFSFTGGFFLLVGAALAGLAIGGLIAFAAWSGMTGRPSAEIQQHISNTAFANAYRVVQLLTVVFGMFLPTLAVAYLLHRRPLALIGYRPAPLRWFGMAVAIMLTAVFVAGALGYPNMKIPLPPSLRAAADRLEADYARQVAVIIGNNGWQDYLVGLFMMALLPAVCEETLFRGGLQNFLTRASGRPWLSIIVISIVFSVFHFSFYGFLPRLFLGAVLGILYYYGGSLWLPIAAHFLYNALAVTQLRYLTKEGRNAEAAMADQLPPVWGLLALPLFLFLVARLRKMAPVASSAEPL